MTVQSANWLLIWAYAIGIFDLVSAVFFFLISLKTICSRLSWLSIFAVTFGLFWVTMIFMLLVGIHGRKPQCVRDWIIFCCIGIVFEMGLIVYAIFNDSSFNTGLLKNGILLIAGLVVECMFLYIIYRFYVTMEFCQNCQKPKLVDPCDKKKVNKRQAKAKKKQLPKMRHKGKIVTNGPKVLGGRTIANIPTQPLKLNRSSAASSEY
ncbi:uncharacterized protein [Drosophila bipectinata]|uniref:uncharacterized protein n=1 Tax=Drosophila bipectinata TaxID=42026 RepID=UPI001C89A8DF|nr:uncharacterized protein LOC108119061 [Drosophila bipectinata]